MSLFGTGRKEGILAVLLLISLALLQHAPGTLFGQPRGALDPAGALSGVPSVAPNAEAATNQTVLLPAMRQAGTVAREGSWPTWNPYSRFGEPFQVSGAPLFYPPYWPLMLDGGGRWLDWVLLFHSVLACVLAYRMLRSMSVSRYGAFVGAGLYGLGWFLTTAFDRLPEAAAAAWLPWIVTASWQALFARGRASQAAILGLAIAVPFATGGTATATLGLFLALACTIAGLLAIDREDRRAAATTTLSALAITALCTAPLWLPALQLTSTVAEHQDTSSARLQTAGLLALVAPGLFGELGTAAPQALQELNPAADSLELALYPGALTLLVALMGLMRPKRTRLALFWILVAGGSLLLALDGPISAIGHEISPLLHRRPGAILAVFHLATVILVSLGLENFFDAPRARPFAVPVAATLVLLTAAITATGLFVVPGAGLSVLRVATASVDAADLTAALAHARRALIAPLVTASLLAIAFLAWRRIGILRFKQAVATIALGELCVLALLHAPRVEEPTSARTASMVPTGSGRVIRVGAPDLAPAAWMAGHDDIRAIDTDGDQVLQRTARYLELVEPGVVRVHHRAHVGPLARPQSVDDPGLAVASLGVAVATRAPTMSRFLPLVAAPGTGSADARTPQPFAALDTVPRIRMAFAARPADDASDAERTLRDGDPLHRLDHLVVESPPPDFRCVRPDRAPTVEVLEDLPHRLRVRTDLGDGRGYLVVADAMAPGWRATVDGHPTPIVAADLAFRAVPLREGAHEVVFEYRPAGLALGVSLAAIGLLAAALMLAWRRR